MPRSAGHRRENAAGVRVPTGNVSVDPIREIAINGAAGGVDLYELGRGGVLDLTITNDTIHVIHPSGFNPDGSRAFPAGLVDPMVPDGPWTTYPANTVEPKNPLSGSSNQGNGINPFGDVVLLLAWEFTGGMAAEPFWSMYGEGFNTGTGPAVCSPAILSSDKRTSIEDKPVSVEESWDAFCFIFPSAPGCAPCAVKTAFTLRANYIGLSVAESTEHSGDIMVIEGGTSHNKVAFFTLANRFAESGGDLVQVGGSEASPASIDTTGLFPEIEGLFELDTEFGSIPKALKIGLGPSFAEDPNPRHVRITLSDEFNYNFVNGNYAPAADPGGDTWYNPGPTNYRLSLRAFTGGGDAFIAEPGITRVGEKQARSVKPTIGAVRDAASGVRTNVSDIGSVR